MDATGLNLKEMITLCEHPVLPTGCKGQGPPAGRCPLTQTFSGQSLDPNYLKYNVLPTAWSWPWLLQWYVTKVDTPLLHIITNGK